MVGTSPTMTGVWWSWFWTDRLPASRNDEIREFA